MLSPLGVTNIADKIVGRAITTRGAIQKRSQEQNYNKLSKDITSDISCYPKVGRSITIREAIEKSPIFLSQYSKTI